MSTDKRAAELDGIAEAAEAMVDERVDYYAKIKNPLDVLPGDIEGLGHYVFLERKKVGEMTEGGVVLPTAMEGVGKNKRPMREAFSRVLTVGADFNKNVKKDDLVAYMNGAECESEFGKRFANYVLVHEQNVVCRVSDDALRRLAESGKLPKDHVEGLRSRGILSGSNNAPD